MVFIGREIIGIEYLNVEREVIRIDQRQSEVQHSPIIRWTTGHLDLTICGASLIPGISSECGNHSTGSRSIQEEYVSLKILYFEIWLSWFLNSTRICWHQPLSRNSPCTLQSWQWWRYNEDWMYWWRLSYSWWEEERDEREKAQGCCSRKRC